MPGVVQADCSLMGKRAVWLTSPLAGLQLSMPNHKEEEGGTSHWTAKSRFWCSGEQRMVGLLQNRHLQLTLRHAEPLTYAWAVTNNREVNRCFDLLEEPCGKTSLPITQYRFSTVIRRACA